MTCGAISAAANSRTSRRSWICSGVYSNSTIPIMAYAPRRNAALGLPPRTHGDGRRSLMQEIDMSKVWVITGAGRGMGVDIAKAALTAGYEVVATGRSTDKVAEALGQSDKLL